MKHLIYTRKIYINEGYTVSLSYGAKQSMAVTFQVKCGSFARGRFLAGDAIITTISLDTGTR